MERFSLKCDYFLIEEHTVTGKQRVVTTSRKKRKKITNKTAKKGDLTIPHIKETNLRLYFIQMWMDTLPVLNMEFNIWNKWNWEQI